MQEQVILSRKEYEDLKEKASRAGKDGRLVVLPMFRYGRDFVREGIKSFILSPNCSAYELRDTEAFRQVVAHFKEIVEVPLEYSYRAKCDLEKQLKKIFILSMSSISILVIASFVIWWRLL